MCRYCKEAVKKIGIVIDDSVIHSEESRENLEKWSHVVKFYSLRLMLAPLIETIILLDRLLYMMESGWLLSTPQKIITNE